MGQANNRVPTVLSCAEYFRDDAECLLRYLVLTRSCFYLGVFITHRAKTAIMDL